MQKEVKELNGLIEAISKKMVDRAINDRYLISRMAVIVNEFDAEENAASIIIPTDLEHPTTYKYPNRTGRTKLNSTVWENGKIKTYGDKVYLLYQTNNISQGWLEINEPFNIAAASSKSDIDLYENKKAVYHTLNNTTIEHLQNGWVFDDSVSGNYTDTNISFATANVVPLTQCSTNLWYDTNTIIGFNNFTLTYNGSPYVYDFVTSLDVGGGVGTGTLNILTGELTMTHVYYEITGSTCASCSFEGTNLCRVNAPSLKYGTNNQYKSGVCDRYTVVTSYGAVNGHNGTIAFNGGSGGSFLLCDVNITTYQQLVASLDANPIHIVYPLSMTYQFTARPLSSIVGTNTVVATNPVTIRYTDGGLFRADGDAVVLRNSGIVNDVGYLTSGDFKTLNNTSIVGSGDITIDKSFVGLGNVDNTSDVNKPISTATQTALNDKQATLVSGTNIKTINNTSILGSGNLDVGTKFIKGTPINLYDTDGETILYSRNPENLVFYDGESGENISNPAIYVSPTADVALSASGTQYYPNWTVKNSQGEGFEIASNGDVTCLKNGKVLVIADAYVTSTGTSHMASIRITKNRVVVGTSTGQAIYNHGQLSSSAVVSVSAGDAISFQTASNGTSCTLKTGSSMVCIYLEDYYVTRTVSEVDTETINSAFSKTSGSSTINVAKARKQGNVVTIYFDIVTTAAISAGNNVLTGVVQNDLKPTVGYVTGYTYYGAKNIGVNIQTDGVINIRAVTALASGDNFLGSITYVI